MDSISDFRRALLAQDGRQMVLEGDGGTTVIPQVRREGSNLASAYVFGRHLVVFCDPRLADQLASFELAPGEPDATAPLDAFASWGSEVGAELVGMGAMRVLLGPPLTASVHHVSETAVEADRDSPADVTRIQDLVNACSAEDVDDAGIEMDDLDPVIRCIEREPGGPYVAYASAFPDDDFGGRWDVGVLTHPGHRNRGLGRAAVARLVGDLVADGRTPIYRHNLEHTWSGALAESLGFKTATRLAAIRFPAVDQS